MTEDIMQDMMKISRKKSENSNHILLISWEMVAQTVKNLPAMQETWVQSLGGEDPPEEGMATHSSILA